MASLVSLARFPVPGMVSLWLSSEVLSPMLELLITAKVRLVLLPL